MEYEVGCILTEFRQYFGSNIQHGRLEVAVLGRDTNNSARLCESRNLRKEKRFVGEPVI